MVSLNKLKLYGNISERYLTSIKKGDIVIVTFPDIEGLSVKVPIHRIGNVIDNASRTFRIEMKINNRQNTLKPNMYSTIQVNDYKTESALVVPSVSIKQDIKGNYLYVANQEEGEFKARNRNLDYARIDQMEQVSVPQRDIQAFLKEGAVSPQGGVQ